LVNGGILNFDTGSFTDLSLGTLYPDLFLGCGVWSPDATRLACEGDSEADPSLNGVYTVRSSDGGDLQKVTSNPFDFGCPGDYSPNGKRLVVPHGTLVVVKLDGSGQRQITPSGMFFDLCSGSWSPQGNEILFSAHVPDFNYRSTIWVVHSDGSGLRQIPVPRCGGLRSDPISIGCQQPTWSPDGTKIVFKRLDPSAGQADIYTVNADGSGLSAVTNTGDQRARRRLGHARPHPMSTLTLRRAAGLIFRRAAGVRDVMKMHNDAAELGLLFGQAARTKLPLGGEHRRWRSVSSWG
jgi:Tol biopolymer transport system component